MAVKLCQLLFHLENIAFDAGICSKLSGTFDTRPQTVRGELSNVDVKQKTQEQQRRKFLGFGTVFQKADLTPVGIASR